MADGPVGLVDGRAMDRPTLVALGAPADNAPPFDSPTGSRQLRVRLLAVDAAAVAIAWVLLGYELDGRNTMASAVGPGVLAALVTLVALQGLGGYRTRTYSRRADELGRLFTATVFGSAAYLFMEWQMGVIGHDVLVCAGSAFVLLATGRWQFRRWLRARRAEGQYLRRVLLVGSNRDAARLHTMLRCEPELGYAVAGVVGDHHMDPMWSDLPGHPSVAGIPGLAAKTGASGVLIVPYALSSDLAQGAIAVASHANLHVEIWPGICGVGSPQIRPVPVSGETFFYVDPKRPRPWQFAVKRILDVTIAGLLLLFLSPLIAAAALAIKMEDGGPVVYAGKRIGRHGEPFDSYKLRSMSVTTSTTQALLRSLNERTDGPQFKASNDPRVTKVGKILRALSVDELPQLWNVLRGTMSLVGPRPALPSEVAQFDADFQRRHSVKPGMTGLWQVEARHNPSFNAYRRLDLRYVDNWSLRLDLAILLATVPSVFSQALHSLSRARRRARS